MNINDIINAMPYLSKRELYEIHTAVNKTIKQVEEAEQKYRESVRQRQHEIVDEMNKCLREFHNLSASLRGPDSDDYLDSYSDCFIDSVYDYPVFGFTIDCDNDICVSVNPNDPVAEWYRKEKEELEKRKRG